ncbi:hypothetical protein QYE76_033531 [Lolium multiflorum]|uniref:Uncharacterized protein n=1 Tax=Lolium multiflorum TaxID=4521 RepID=A0AAD8VMG3_LOLMU|nr:hypothetical protein QYE76_033531 [Lolium multiflorum]
MIGWRGQGWARATLWCGRPFAPPTLPFRLYKGPDLKTLKEEATDSDYHRHWDRQPRTYHQIHEEISGCWSCNSSSAKRFPHCSTAISSSGGSISPSCRKHSTGNNSADLTSTPKAYATKIFKQLTEAEKWELEQDLLNAMLNNAWGKPDAGTSEIQDFKKGVGEFFDKLICKQKEQQALHYELHKNIALQRRVTLGQAENIRTLQDKNAELNKQLADAQGASSSLATTSSELENLRPSYQELEIKLKEAEQQKERAEKQLAEKNSELIREKGEFVLKRNADSETIKRQQKELNGLRKYMETAEHHWDLLAENILADEPLEDELQKERDAEARPAESGTQFTWTSSKDAPEEEPKSSAATSEEDEESDEDVSSPAEGTKGKNPEGNASPSKAE